MLVERSPLVGRFTELASCRSALLDEDVPMLLITGPAGIGKTRLVTELGGRLEREREVLHCVTSPGIASTPLAALAHLLPDDALAPDAAEHPARAFRRIIDHFRGRSRPVVLSVDDVDQLDSTSVALVHQLMTQRLVQLVATLRSGVELPDGVAVLRRLPGRREIELTQLGEDDVDTLLHLSFGMPVDAALGQQLWARSQGNPLVLRELVHRVIADGAVAEAGGVLLMTKPLPAAGPAAELFLSRVQRCSAAAVEILELLAAGGPLGLGLLEAVAGPAAVEELEQQALVKVEPSQRRGEVSCAHPILAEALRERLTVLGRRRLLRRLVETVGRYGARRRDDALRLAAWQLDAGLPIEPEALLSAARLARLADDSEQVERYARMATLAAGPGSAAAIEASTLMGEALAELARFAEAEEVLAAATAVEPHAAAAIAVIRAANLAEGLLRPQDGRAVVEAAYQRAPSGFLNAARAWHLMVDGRPAAALALLADTPDTSDRSEPRTVVARAQVAAPCLAMAGRTAEALRLVAEAESVLGSMNDLAALNHRGLHRLNEALALCEAGRLDEAEACAAEIHARVATGTAIAARVWAAATLGRVLLVAGKLRGARRWYLEAASLAATRGLPAPGRAALVGLIAAGAQLGDAAEVRSRVAELERLPGPFRFMAPEETLAAGWAAAAGGAYGEAAAIFVAGAGPAEDTGHVTTAAWLVHEAVRVSPPAARQVTARLDEWARRTDSALVAARAEHVRAVADGRPELAVLAARNLAERGLLVPAAEALCWASTHFERDGERRRSRATMVEAQQLITRLDGARTPGLAPASTVAELTGREREIAVLAATGHSSKDIAARLHLSARTVDNHLQRIYDKVGVNSRQDLGAALGER